MPGVLVHALQIFNCLFDKDRVQNPAFFYFQRLGGDAWICFRQSGRIVDAHLDEQWSFMDRIEENCLVALVHESRTDCVEKAHPINGLDVPVDRVLIERLIWLMSDVDEYGV